MIGTLLPPEAIAVEATGDMWSAALLPEEEAFIERAVQKRRREFTAGRSCARLALARLGIEGFALRAAEDRSPIWPPGVVGSITHSGTYCAVAVARAGRIASLGIDAESAEPLKPPLRRFVCTEREQRAHEALPAAPGGTDWAKLTFSAKEAFYKCYYPLARHFLDFKDVELDLRPDEGTFHARIIAESAPSAGGVRGFGGSFATDGEYVFTSAVLTADEIEAVRAP